VLLAREAGKDASEVGTRVKNLWVAARRAQQSSGTPIGRTCCDRPHRRRRYVEALVIYVNGGPAGAANPRALA
jgi:hypothetical protein